MWAKVVFLILSLILLPYSLKTSDKRPFIISLGLIVAAISAITGYATTIGFYLFILSTLMIPIFRIGKSQFNRYAELIVCIIALWSIYANLCGFYGWSYNAEIKLSLMVPILSYAILLTKGFNKQKAFVPISIIVVELLLKQYQFFSTII